MLQRDAARKLKLYAGELPILAYQLIPFYIV
jgi:hypothetical protein